MNSDSLNNENDAPHFSDSTDPSQHGFTGALINKNVSINFNILDSLIEFNSIRTIVINHDGTVINVSKSFANYLNYSTNELLEKHLSLITETPQLFLNNLEQNTEINNQSVFKNQNLKTKDGFFTNTTLSKYAYSVNNETITYLAIIFSEPESASLNDELHKKKDEMLYNKEQELMQLNSELNRLSKSLDEQHQNIEMLHNRILENEIRLKLAFNAVDDGIWDWNIDSGNIFFSDRFFTMLGYDAYHFAHTLESWKELLHNNEQQTLADNLKLIREGKITSFTLEYQMRTNSGEFKWILSRGSTVENNSNGFSSRILGTHVDISEQKEAQLKLKQSEWNLIQQNEEYQIINEQLNASNEKIITILKQLEENQTELSSLLKTVPASIGQISNRKVLYANDYTVFMTGYELNELIGHDTSFLYPNIEEYTKVYNALYKESAPGETRSVTTKWKMKNDTIIDVYVSTNQIENESETAVFTFSALDVTSQRIYEEELVNARDEAEKAERLKTVFLCNMSHELRTPMNGIVGFAEMLLGPVNNSKREQYLKIIINSSKQLLKIISDIVDISKIETNDVETYFTTISLQCLFNELQETYKAYLENRNKTNISLISYSFGANIADNINTDENKLRQIFINLINNAVKFTECGQIQFGCKLAEDFIEFYVKDTGIGIDENEYESIFECFRQTDLPNRKKYGGTGLGLAISKGFVEILGGKIWVSSKKDEGSTFYFTIPYLPNKISLEPEIETTNEGIWARYHVLVVEDDLNCLTLIQEILEDTGIRLTHAVTGLEAVKFCRKDDSINVVLMDMRLPEMDGYEATRRIKEFRPAVPIIAQTAHALSEDKTKCIKAGCDDYITKPLEREKLFDLISLHLKK